MIGFEEERYNVSESGGQVNIFVAILNGQLSTPIRVSVMTMDSSATSKHHGHSNGVSSGNPQ